MICPYCRSEVVDGINFCPKCGGDLKNAPVVAQPVEQQVQQAPQQYTQQQYQQPQQPNMQNVLPNNSLAVPSLVCGILSLFCCGSVILGVPAIICGVMGVQNAKSGKVNNQNIGMCYAGAIMGGIATGLFVINLIIALFQSFFY